VDFNIIDQLLIRYSAFIRLCRKNGITVGQHVTCLEVSRRPVSQERSIVQ
jgi:hypothetical protein